MLENGETVPESGAPEVVPRFNRLAHTLQNEGEAEPIFEQLSAKHGRVKLITPPALHVSN
jgi:hypothetical protein